MSLALDVHPDILDVLSNSNIDEFNIPQIRDVLLASSMKGKNKATVRVFVSRHLDMLVQQGVLVSSGKHRGRVFKKTKLFSQIESQTLQECDKDTLVTEDTKKDEELKNDLNQLQNKKRHLNAELAILVAEINELNSIMADFPRLNRSIKALYEQSTHQSVTLTGQISALTKSIEQLQKESA